MDFGILSSPVSEAALNAVVCNQSTVCTAEFPLVDEKSCTE
eukprot:CAMPEP_0198725366 /NCGR_PEP_ID=MMETSP1475-20131203/2680_1 /TAXON_ID= ORGANISM="Unidentified sp., Strain CCMP1999" /NCGR_SAMPLE_ID=MMETSP1475 /ASSEMBLY_ACC=CAM_ASM_001111 /LENGTH=40 /DNA_ID= /DNA_START= /DNA_END= /DNA_ORIENTATION=